MKQELFDIDFTSSAVFTISYVCLLLLGWKGCPTRSMKQNLIGMLFTLLDVSHYVLMLLPYRRLGLISCLIFSFCRATLKIDFDCHKRAQKKGIANWMPQWFMKLIQNGTPKRMHFTFVKALRTYGFGKLQSKLQLQNCLLMNMWHVIYTFTQRRKNNVKAHELFASKASSSVHCEPLTLALFW